MKNLIFAFLFFALVNSASAEVTSQCTTFSAANLNYGLLDITSGYMDHFPINTATTTELDKINIKAYVTTSGSNTLHAWLIDNDNFPTLATTTAIAYTSVSMNWYSGATTTLDFATTTLAANHDYTLLLASQTANPTIRIMNHYTNVKNANTYNCGGKIYGNAQATTIMYYQILGIATTTPAECPVCEQCSQEETIQCSTYNGGDIEKIYYSATTTQIDASTTETTAIYTLPYYLLRFILAIISLILITIVLYKFLRNKL